MNVQPLDESWQIVLVVTSENMRQFHLTLEDIKEKSFRNEVSILASDIPAVREQLAGLSLPVAYRLPPTIEPGVYWVTVTSAHEFVSLRTIFLQAGTRVPECWDARLVAAGQRAGVASAISPQCARHPILSAFASSQYQPELTVDEVDQWLNDYVDGIEYSVPVVLESCALLQGTYWQDRAPPIQSDRILLEDLRANGACLLATDQLYVDDFNTKYCIDVSFLPKAYRDACAQRPPLARTHHALSELSRRRESPGLVRRCLPVQLQVGHSWGGGLGRWMEDYVAADTAHNHLILRSIGDLSGFGQTVALYRSTEIDVPIRTWTLSEPIISINVTSYEYRAILEELVDQYSVESIVISSLVGHSLDLLRTDVPTAVVLHDFFPFCPALYATFGSPCISCSDGELRACSRENPRNSYFKFETNEHWLAIRRDFVRLLLQESITIFAPSQSVVDRYRKLESRLSEKCIYVVAHGLDRDLAQSLNPSSASSAPASPPRGRLKIVMLGRLTEEKGGELLGPILSQIGNFADVYLLGTGESGERFKSFSGVTIRESYEKHELGHLLHDIQPDLGMLLSTVPETFSYTLSELWAARIPVLATRLGAFTDRIAEGGNGWLVQPDAAVVLEKLRTLNLDRTLLESVKRNVVEQSVRTTADMVSDYAAAMPRSDYVPISRFNLPRRSYRNPYGQASSEGGAEALYINHQFSYSKVLAEFLRYTSRKMEQSPKLPHWVRGTLGRSLRQSARYLDS